MGDYFCLCKLAMCAKIMLNSDKLREMINAFVSECVENGEIDLKSDNLRALSARLARDFIKKHQIMAKQHITLMNLPKCCVMFERIIGERFSNQKRIETDEINDNNEDSDDNPFDENNESDSNNPFDDNIEETKTVQNNDENNDANNESDDSDASDDDDSHSRLSKLLDINDFDIELNDIAYNEESIKKLYARIVDLKTKIAMIRNDNDIDASTAEHLIKRLSERKQELEKHMNYVSMRDEVEIVLNCGGLNEKVQVEKRVLALGKQDEFRDCDLSLLKWKLGINEEPVPKGYEEGMFDDFITSLIDTGVVRYSSEANMIAEQYKLFRHCPRNCNYDFTNRAREMIVKRTQIKLPHNSDVNELWHARVGREFMCPKYYTTEAKDIKAFVFSGFVQPLICSIGSVSILEPEYLHNMLNWNLICNNALEQSNADDEDIQRVKGFINVAALVNKRFGTMFRNTFIDELEHYINPWKSQFERCMKSTIPIEFEFDVKLLKTKLEFCKTKLPLETNIAGFTFSTEEEVDRVYDLVTTLMKIVHKTGGRGYELVYNDIYDITVLSKTSINDHIEELGFTGLNLLTVELINKWHELTDEYDIPDWLIFPFVNHKKPKHSNINA